MSPIVTSALRGLLLLFIAALLAGCKPPPGPAARPGGGGTGASSAAGGRGLPLPTLTTYPATPQAVMEAVQSAAHRGAWGEYVQYLDPETIDSAASGYLDAAIDFASRQKSGAKSADAGGEQAASAIAALLKDRGITAEMLASAKSDPQQRAEVEKLVGDRSAFVADVLTRTGGGPSRMLADAKLENWDVKADTASATMAVERDGQRIDASIGLRLIDGRWKVAL